MYNYTNLETINSRGLAQMCEIYPYTNACKLFESDTRGKMKKTDYKNITDNDRVYVITSELPWFVQTILPGIDCRFTLITGSSVSGPCEEIGNYEVHNLCEDTRIKSWFSQNIDTQFTDSEVLNPLPLGVDFHKEAHKKTPQIQEKELFSVASKLPCHHHRFDEAICNFHHLLHIGHDPLCRNRYLSKATSDRYECLKNTSLKKLPKQQRIDYWKEHGKAKWVYSPMGKGQDCHRTYEAIVLGSIPIVNSNSWIHPMFHNMPVKIVDTWNTKIINDIVPNPEHPKMKLRYWDNVTKIGYEN